MSSATAPRAAALPPLHGAELLLVPGESLRKWFTGQAPAVRTLVHDIVQLQRQQTEASRPYIRESARA